MKKWLCTILMAALLLAIAAPALADPPPVPVPESVTIYMLSSNRTNRWVNYGIDLGDVTGSTRIGKPRSSNVSVLKINGISRYSSVQTYYDQDITGGTWFSAAILVEPIKAGTANISVKIDGVAHKIAATVKKYANPVKSFVLTGVSSENLSTQFARTSTVMTELEKASKKGYLKVSAKSGWKIEDVRWSDESTGLTFTRWLKKPVSSVSLPIPAMKTTKNYYISLSFVNTSNGATMPITYHLLTEPENR